MKLITTTLLLTCFGTITNVFSAKILGIFPMPGRSHYILGSSLMRGLAAKGHDVTVISPFSEKNPPSNYKELTLQELYEKHLEKMKTFNMFDFTNFHKFLLTYFLYAMGAELTEHVLSDSKVQDLLKSNAQFDAVIVEQFGDEALKGIAQYYGVPLILLSSIGANRWVNSLAGNPSPIAYIPDSMLGYTSHMTFCQRLENTYVSVFNYIFDYIVTYPTHQRLLKKYVSKSLDLYDILYNPSIILMNSHPSVNQPVPYVPNMIDIGGYHIQPSKKLPKDLQDYLDNAKNGVIYFSMGSNLRSADLPAEQREALLKTFSKLKQNVLWKWEDENLPGQPSNVKTSKWLPQSDILAHPNVKVFITHGGLLSTTETVYHGVPILAIPIFGDQKLNAAGVVNNGYGLSLPLEQLSEEKLTELLTELLDNPKYKNNAKKRSQLSHDRPLKPMDNAVYWIEYVIRHKGAPHLRVAGLDLPWYQYFLLDVISFIAVIITLSVFISYQVFKKFICPRICGRNAPKIKTN